ncbi:hypothetical protein [Psychrobacter sp. ENNN9_III]|nr:hypothetical protein [Psychrobacter sp. ENNN9_III]
MADKEKDNKSLLDNIKEKDNKSLLDNIKLILSKEDSIRKQY